MRQGDNVRQGDNGEFLNLPENFVLNLNLLQKKSNLFLFFFPEYWHIGSTQ